MSRFSIVVLGLLSMMVVPSWAQSDVFFVPDPQTAVWTYRETNHETGAVSLSQYTVQTMIGDAVQGLAKVQVKTTSLNAAAPADSTNLYFRFEQGECILDVGKMFSADLYEDALENTDDWKNLSEEDRARVLKEMDDYVSVKGEVRGIPRYPQVGRLPDYELKVKVLVMSVKIKGKSRKITGVETVRTPAGDYECFVMTEEVSAKMMLMTEKSVIKTWYAYGIGMVKQETYVDDQLESSLILDTINW